VVAAKPSGDTIAATLAERGRRVAEVSAAGGSPPTGSWIDPWTSSAPRMSTHLNRIGGASSEQTLVGLLRRRESLIKAPVG
jgi:hypothetical protein